ncbi:MAG: metalloregulator ArsR/SmtB family transcription factor [Polyangiaceae bacterium]
MDRPVLEGVAGVFSVLSEPTRLQILELLGRGPLTVGEIVSALDMKQANVSKQLGVLSQAGLVTRTRDGACVRYSIADPMIFELCDLVCGKLKRDAEARIASLK